MCEPTTIFMAATALSGAMSAKASIDQGRYQKKVADYNAAVDRNQAIEVKNKAITAESAERQKAMELLSTQRATAAARGVDVDFGTALTMQEDTALIGEINAMRVRENADDQVASLNSQALLTESAGAAAQSQGNMAAVGTLIGSAGTMAGAKMKPNTVDPMWYGV